MRERGIASFQAKGQNKKLCAEQGLPLPPSMETFLFILTLKKGLDCKLLASWGFDCQIFGVIHLIGVTCIILDNQEKKVLKITS